MNPATPVTRHTPEPVGRTVTVESRADFGVSNMAVLVCVRYCAESVCVVNSHSGKDSALKPSIVSCDAKLGSCIQSFPELTQSRECCRHRQTVFFSHNSVGVPFRCRSNSYSDFVFAPPHNGAALQGVVSLSVITPGARYPG